MKRRKIFSILIIMIAIVLFITPAWSWDDEVTHKDLTGFAADQSVLNSVQVNYLSIIGIENLNEILLWPGHVCDDNARKINCSFKDWLKYGAEKEDAEISEISGRFNNHFHDPLSGEGIDDWELGIYHVIGQSSLAWAQDSAAQSAVGMPEGDQSWATLRGLYKAALSAADDADRKALFAQLFKGLGHQMHLVQDMAVPAHVRNDSHPWETAQGSESWWKRQLARKNPLYFEFWARKNKGQVVELASSGAVFPTLAYDMAYAQAHGGPAVSPVSQLWDADFDIYPSTSTSQGLAEYTNANFFSDDTIMRLQSDALHYFPYPNLGSTNFIDYMDLLPEEFIAPDNQVEQVLYLRNQHQDQERIITIDA